jgi:outer membrane lipoprotein carrier protein
MRAFPRLSLVLFFLAPIAASANPGGADPPQTIQTMEARYGTARTLQVSFLERYLQNGKFVRAEAGEAYFLRPGKMRWDYESPEKNTFVVDGTYTWFYSPADRTATRVPTKQSEDWRTPLAFLTSHMKLSRLCAKIEQEKESATTQAGDVVFRCELRDAPDERPSKTEGAPALRSSGQAGVPVARESVLFEVSVEGELRRLVVNQEGGIEMEFSFSGWKWNPALDKSLFQFSPPRGVAIVDGLLPESPGVRQ